MLYTQAFLKQILTMVLKTKNPICQSNSTKKYDELFFKDKKLRLCIGKRGFSRWIQFVNVAISQLEPENSGSSC